MQRFIFLLLSTLLFTTSSFAGGSMTTVSFQNGTAGYSGTEDTFVHEKFPTTNFGLTGVLKADGADGAAPAGEVVMLFQWDITSIPAAATITAASITLEFFNSSTGEYDFEPQNSSWSESTAVWADLDAAGAILGTVVPNSNGQTTIPLNAAGVAFVQHWLEDAVNNNHGLALKTRGSNNGVAARSSESSGFRPRLTVTYTEEPAPPTNAELFALIQTLQAENVSQASEIGALQAANTALQGLLAGASRVGNDVFLDGMNVHVRNGLGATDGDQGAGPQVNGLGNLIVGYDEPRSTGSDKGGSHNLIVGQKHNYQSYGGLIAGFQNTVSGSNATVSGGLNNIASGFTSSVSGGDRNTASEGLASISGGFNNTASGERSSVGGGQYNTASGFASSVSGGFNNTASGSNASVSGGVGNTASAGSASVSGGSTNTASGFNASVSGGFQNTASQLFSSVNGGESNQATGQSATVSAGAGNTATGFASNVTGGRSNIVSGNYSIIVGGNSNTTSANDDIAP